MAVLKCKMCGGNIEVGENRNIGVCDSCGSTMTIPNVNDERILNLFDRANHFRLQNEFDKALAAYESILSEDNKNAEAHWGCVLSRYGIEYVEDPKTHKRVPTCHRVQSESVLSDLDYKAAIEYSDDISAKNLYKQEAEAIAEIQKNILSIANNESPYDVFICYKETDNSGRRTVDSTFAQDMYYQLTNEGYKVFFSRITLEDKLGTEYEPYIFSALNSAKVMLVIGTNKDYFNAIWVKNEWARFLDLARKDKSKMIIPCYRDMDAYDLPDELSMFQSQDMSKIGFVQDLIRGIKKVLQKETPQPTVTVVNNTAEAFNSEALLKRAFMLLEDAEWQKADEILEQVLNHEPENAEAYVGKLMIDVKVNKEENLKKKIMDFSNNTNYINAIKFADNKMRNNLQNYCSCAKQRYNQNILDKAEAQKEREQKELIQEYRNSLLYKEKYMKFSIYFPPIFVVCMIIAYYIAYDLSPENFVSFSILLSIFAPVVEFFVIYMAISLGKNAKKQKKQLDKNGVSVIPQNEASDNNDENNNETNAITEYPCPACDKNMNLEGSVFVCSNCGYTVKKEEINFFRMSIEKVTTLKSSTTIDGTIINGVLLAGDEIYINSHMYTVQYISVMNGWKTIKQAIKGMKASVTINNPHNDVIQKGELIIKHKL